MAMEWIDLALINNEDQLTAALTSIPPQGRAKVLDDFVQFLALSQDDVEISLLRVMVERARGFALPVSLWTRPLYASSSVRSAGALHLQALGLQVSPERLDAVQALYEQFATPREPTYVTEDLLKATGYRCGHCGLAFCDEDLLSKGFASPHGTRGALKVDSLKLHWELGNHKRRRPTMDHDWPVSTFGNNGESNLRVLCGGCNEGKANIIAVEQMGSWTGLLERRQLVGHQVSLALFYAQIRRAPICSKSGVGRDSAELTVELRDPTGPAILDNLITVASP